MKQGNGRAPSRRRRSGSRYAVLAFCLALMMLLTACRSAAGNGDASSLPGDTEVSQDTPSDTPADAEDEGEGSDEETTDPDEESFGDDWADWGSDSDDYDDYYDAASDEEEFYTLSPDAYDLLDTAKPEFSWTELAGATSYKLVIKQYRNGAYRKVREVEGIRGTSYTPDFELPANEMYSWRVYGSVDGKLIASNPGDEDSLFVARFDPKTHPANQGLNFTFNGSITEEVLRNYMSRSMCMHILDRDYGLTDFEENLRMALYTGAKYINRAVANSSFYPSVSELDLHALYKEYIDRAHEIDPELIFEAGIFEACGPLTNEFAIPAYVFQAFQLPVEQRNFDYTKMVYEDGHYMDTGRDGMCTPDMSHVETQMWFYYRATLYIDAGFEGLHLGSTPSMSDVDSQNGYAGWLKVTNLIRAYAKTHARRGYVILNGHTLDMRTPSGQLIFDYNMWMLVGKVPAGETAHEPTAKDPQKLILEEGYASSIYGRTVGGTHYCGWKTDRALYLVELDNYGLLADAVNQPGSNSAGMYPWGLDEIGWFNAQPENYRREWLSYTYRWLRDNDPYGYFEMPGSRVCSMSNGAASIYRANNANWGYASGKDDEETIRSIWIQSRNR